MNKLAVYEQLAHEIKQAIASGILLAGDQLPSVRKFALEKQINPNTAAKVYKTLEMEGIIISIPSKGNFISDDAAGLQALRLAELKAALQVLLGELRDNDVNETEVLQLVEGVYHDFEH